MSQRDMSNILSGPYILSLDSVDVGHTREGIKLVVEPSLREQTSDIFGTVPVDYIHTGEEITLEVKVAEWTFTNIQKIFPFTVSATGYVEMGITPGTRMSEIASELKLHPVELGAEDASCDIVFWKAAAAGKVEISFASGKDRIFTVNFRIIPDLTKPEGQQIGRIGA